MTERKKIILDVDTGIDDALGILLAIESRAFDILGITVTAGNVSLEQATLNTCKVVNLAGERKINVVPGAYKPVVRYTSYEHHIHGEDGLGGALPNQPLRVETTQQFAPDFLIEQIHRYPGEVTLVMTAPLTNLALALQKDASIVHKVKEVISMGGAFKQGGNVTPVAEFNMYADPEAAKLVVEAGFPITFVGLDVTQKVLFTEAHVKQLSNSKYGAFVEVATKKYMDAYYLQNGVQACALHDPLAVGVALDHTIIQSVPVYVTVETTSTVCDGQTVCDWQNKWNKQPNAKIALQVDSERFLSRFCQTLQI